MVDADDLALLSRFRGLLREVGLEIGVGDLGVPIEHLGVDSLQLLELWAWSEDQGLVLSEDLFLHVATLRDLLAVLARAAPD